MFGRCSSTRPRLLAVSAPLVDLGRFLARLDLADDDPLADDHLEGIDRGVFGQRIEIGRRRPLPAGVAERLDDAGAGDPAADPDLVMGAEPDRGHLFRDAFAAQHQHPALERIVLLEFGHGRHSVAAEKCD